MIKQIVFIVCGVLLSCIGVYSQDQKVIDSLQRVLRNKIGAERFQPLYDLAFEYIHRDNKKALEIIQQSEEAALMSGDSLSIVRSKRVKGQILYLLEKMQEASNVFYDILPVAMRNDFHRERLYIVHTLGKLNLFAGNYDKALIFYFKTLELANKSDDKEHIAIALHSIGIAYYKLKDYQKGLEYFKESYQLHGFIQTPTSYMLTNMGLCYAQLLDFLSARKFVEKSLRDCGPDCSEKFRINIEYAFGLIAQGEEKFQDAEKYFLKSYSLARKINDTRFQLDNIYLLTEIYINQKHFKEAEIYLLEAEKLMGPHTHFNLEMIKIYSRFSELYREIHDYKKASHYQYKYAQLKDSIYNEELTTSLMKAESEFLERENSEIIESQSEIILLKERMIKDQRMLNVVTGLLGMISIMFLVLLFRNYRKKENLNMLLDQKIKERTLELEVSRSELITALKERDLIIRQASDGISDSLSTIEGLCYTGIREVSDPVAHSYLDRIDKTVFRLTGYLQSVFHEKILIPS